VTRVLAIADDLTGALEAGALFAQAGMSSVVTTGSPRAFDEQVVVVDTETRHASAKEAEAAVAACAADWTGLIYKKTDSTLRGNIGPELRALKERVAYVPAYPEMGRTVVNGCVHIHGVPLAQTEFARDALNPVVSGDVRSLLDPACDCLVFDGETAEDIEEAARTILASGTFRAVAGPAAVAGAMARRLGTPRPIAWPVIHTCLVVNGSRHEVSHAQINCATFDHSWVLFAPTIPDCTDPLDVARSVGKQVCASLAHDALLVFGGDTAYGILGCLGSPALYPIGELLPGVPASRIEGRREILITKAGGFGPPDLIERLRSKLK
jgi:uncharacterized protein YgbK (DUF1537 family)